MKNKKEKRTAHYEFEVPCSYYYCIEAESEQQARKILIEKGGREIFMKTVLNDEEGISLISTCKKIEKFDKES